MYSKYPAIVSDTQNHTETVNIPDSSVKILSLICCSLRNTPKKATFLALIDEHTPDIICGFANPISMKSTTLLPDKYMFRKDCVEGAGGVFLCVHKNFSIAEDPLLSADVEVVWVKIVTSRQT